MKKILLSAIALMGMVSANAQEATTPYILSQVEANTYAVTMTHDEITAAFDAQWVADSWNMGAALPAGTVMFENDDLVITAAVDKTPVYAEKGKLSQIKQENPGYTGYVNAGSTLDQNNWEEGITIQDIATVKAANQGIVAVTPKKAGVLSFGVYAGNNSREIGIYKLATDDEKAEGEFGAMIATNNFRNDGENGTVENAPAFVEAQVEAGRQYALIAGGNKNLCLHQIKFVAQGGSVDGISSAETTTVKNITAIYTLAGAQVSSLQDGVNIVKYSDGTSAKIVK